MGEFRLQGQEEEKAAADAEFEAKKKVEDEEKKAKKAAEEMKEKEKPLGLYDVGEENPDPKEFFKDLLTTKYEQLQAIYKGEE